MKNYHVYQIYYDTTSHQALDLGFEPLDNLANERPDWREFWPMRAKLYTAALAEDEYYGFLSPKFRTKTGLSSEQAKHFMASTGTAVDVFVFSPFVDQSAAYYNIFEQGDWWHPGVLECSQMFIDAVGFKVDLRQLPTHSGNTVFCNYVVARPRFWRAWLKLNERLFDIAERQIGVLGERLNAMVMHDGRPNVPMKVFVMERMATLLLAGTFEFAVRAYNPFSLPLAFSNRQKALPQLLACDALKVAYAQNGFSEHREEFFRLRKRSLRDFGLSRDKAALLG